MVRLNSLKALLKSYLIFLCNFLCMEILRYGVASSQATVLHQAMAKLVPDLVKGDKTVWLPSDTVMVPPTMLTEVGVSLSRTVQKSGEFVVVWPRAFTSSLSTGNLNISRSFLKLINHCFNCSLQDTASQKAFTLLRWTGFQSAMIVSKNWDSTTNRRSSHYISYFGILLMTIAQLSRSWTKSFQYCSQVLTRKSSFGPVWRTLAFRNGKSCRGQPKRISGVKGKKDDNSLLQMKVTWSVKNVKLVFSSHEQKITPRQIHLWRGVSCTPFTISKPTHESLSIFGCSMFTKKTSFVKRCNAYKILLEQSLCGGRLLINEAPLYNFIFVTSRIFKYLIFFSKQLDLSIWVLDLCLCPFSGKPRSHFGFCKCI